MRKIYTLFTVLSIAAAALSSCVKDPVSKFDDFTGEGIVLKLETGDLELSTKADSTRPGDDDGSFNENVLGSLVDVFFFPENASDATAALKSLRVTVRAGGYVQIPVSMGDIYTIFGGTVAGSKSDIYVVANYNGATSIDHAHHYTLNELKNLNLAKAQWGTFPQSSFVMTGKSTITLTDASSNTPASGTVQMKRVAAKLTFKLTVASEIVVENITRDQEGNITKKSLDRWSPVADAMTVYLQYGMNYALLSGNPQMVPAAPKGDGAADSLYTYNPNKLVQTTETKTRHRTIIDDLHQDPVTDEWILETHEADIAVPVYKTMYMQYTGEVGTLTNQDGPFYSYPVTWDPGVQTEPFMKLIIPWNNGSRTKYYYYKVPFAGTSLESNNWYEITLDVQVLGGEDESPVPLECTYKVVDWVPGATSEARTVAARYLSVPKTEWIMYNVDSLTIPITSSHDVQIVSFDVKAGGTAFGNAFADKDKYDSNHKPLAATWIGSDPQIYCPFTTSLITTNVTAQTTVGNIKYTRPNYADADPAPANTSVTTVAGKEALFPSAEITRDKIVLRHALNNNTASTGYDVAPYYFMIRVRHKDDYSYYKDILIEQRPAIIIEPQPNSRPDNTTGYVFVNNGSVGNTSSTYYLGSNGVDFNNANNTNKNMYIISTSVLPTSGSLSGYVLGDTRSDSPNNLGNVNGSGTWTSASARFVDGTNNHTLTNYYPPLLDNTGDNTIAPKIRIASSHGATNTVTYANAIRRCASYQEDGYPAGRWRVPTVAEIMYMAKLNTDKMIPRLLGSNTNGSTTDYWCNSGYVTVSNGNSTAAPVAHVTGNPSTSDKKYVRCVYDEWFWENTTYERLTDWSAFRWGDQSRADVIRTKAVH